MRTLKIVGVALSILFALIVVREAFFGYTAYYVIVPSASLYINGKPISGWLHRNKKLQAYIVTLNGDKHESYLVSASNEYGGSVHSCGDWTASRFPIVAIGDVNPPCLSFFYVEESTNSTPRTEPAERKLTFGPQFLEFTTDDGSRLRTSW